MKTMNFISRHVPTPDQVRLAADKGFDLVHVGDVDAFDTDAILEKFNDCEGTAFAVVHPALALDLASLADPDMPITIGVFQNANRAPEGERPQFEAVSLKIWVCQ